MFLVRKLLGKSSKIIPLVFNDPIGSPRYIEEECPICLEKFLENTNNKAKLPCGHYYHSDCILDWANKRRVLSCPMCRTTMAYVIEKY